MIGTIGIIGWRDGFCQALPFRLEPRGGGSGWRVARPAGARRVYSLWDDAVAITMRPNQRALRDPLVAALFGAA